MPQVLRTTRAKLDLLDILIYLGRHSPKAADRFARKVKEKCQLLAQFPELGALLEDLGPNIRSFTVDRYVIYYRPISDGIEVLRVLHSARDLPPLLES
jgi:toxin ParE1/3/4